MILKNYKFIFAILLTFNLYYTAQTSEDLVTDPIDEEILKLQENHEYLKIVNNIIDSMLGKIKPFDIHGTYTDIEWDDKITDFFRFYVNYKLKNLNLFKKQSHLENISTAKEIFIITHLAPLYQNEITALLKKEQFRNIPRLVLASSVYQIVSKTFLDTISSMIYSEGGEIQGIELKPVKVHFAGGFFKLCLENSIKKLLDISNNVELVLHARQIYTMNSKRLSKLVINPKTNKLNHTLLDKIIKPYFVNMNVKYLYKINGTYFFANKQKNFSVEVKL